MHTGVFVLAQSHVLAHDSKGLGLKGDVEKKKSERKGNSLGLARHCGVSTLFQRNVTSSFKSSLSIVAHASALHRNCTFPL